MRFYKKKILVAVSLCLSLFLGVGLVSATADWVNPSSLLPGQGFLTPINSGEGIQTVNSMLKTEKLFGTVGDSVFYDDGETVKVGIGTDEPGSALDVLGNLKISSVSDGENGSLKFVSKDKDGTLMSGMFQDGNTTIEYSSSKIDEMEQWDTCDGDIGTVNNNSIADKGYYECVENASDGNKTPFCNDVYLTTGKNPNKIDTINWAIGSIRCVYPDNPEYEITNENGSLKFKSDKDSGKTALVINKDGNVGIGEDTADADATLSVNGMVRTINDAGGNSGIKFNDNQSQTKSDSLIVAPGTIMYFNMTNCPAGWKEPETHFVGGTTSTAAGRSLVGFTTTSPLADIGLMVGKALNDMENRPVGEHSHEVIDDGHEHSYKTRRGTKDELSKEGENNMVKCQGVSDDEWDCTNFERNSSGTTVSVKVSGIPGAVAGTPAPYIQLMICEKE